MSTVKEYVIENVSKAYISIKLRGPDGSVVRSIGLAPNKATPVRRLFRRADGSADVEGAKANEDVLLHGGKGRLKIYEREVQRHPPAVRYYNEDDPEPERVAKVLAHRKKLRTDRRRQVSGGAGGGGGGIPARTSTSTSTRSRRSSSASSAPAEKATDSKE